MTQYAKTEIPGIVRDMNTQAIINTNSLEYEKIVQQRIQQKQTMTIQAQIDSLKNEFMELKEIIKQAISGTHNV